ncbi:CU044_5270 family protein [Actinosynnema sp. NPDC050436]|uniref:CU044_5270 family protein n=1 Tax=Actinosynnema sp. NPDC050436 TaxID=3155659 RepID=UPI0033DA374D
MGELLVDEDRWDDDRWDDAVRDVLADTPPMTDESFTAARARVLAGASRPEHAADPVGVAGLLSGAGPVGGGGRSRARRRVAVAAGVAVLAAGGVVAASLTPAPPAAGAVETLTRAADLVVGSADPVVGPGRFRYTVTRDWALAVDDRGDHRFRHLYEGVVETWQPEDPRAEWLRRQTVTGKRQWLEGDEDAARAAGVPLEPTGTRELRAPCGDFVPQAGGGGPCADLAGGWSHPTDAFLATLPRDPAELHRRLVAEAGDLPGGPLGLAADVLATGWVPKDLRAAFYQALTRLPDLRVADRAADLDGRVGVALTAGGGAQAREIVIDPASGRFLGERLIGTEPWEGLPPGTVWSFTSVGIGVAEASGAQP